MKLALLLLITVLNVNSALAASSASCVQLKQELKAMQKAQSQVMSSLVNNHESFASSLEEYSVIVRNTRGASASSNVSAQMNESAEAFRRRGVQGKKMAIKLGAATQDLLARVSACLE